MFLFLPLSLQNMFVFHYDLNLTGCGQYVQLPIEKRKLSQKLNSVFVVDQETTMNRINKVVDSTLWGGLTSAVTNISKPKENAASAS